MVVSITVKPPQSITIDAKVLVQQVQQVVPPVVEQYNGGRAAAELLPVPARRNSMSPGFTTDAQRKAYFATGGWGRSNWTNGNLVYQRTGETTNTLYVIDEPLTSGVIITTFHAGRNRDGDPYLQFLVGNRQQAFHKQTGWQPIQPRELPYLQGMAQEIVTRLQKINLTGLVKVTS